MGDFGFDWGGGGTDYGSLWNDWVGNNQDTYNSALNNAFGGSSGGGGGFWSGLGSAISGIFGGGSGSGSGGNIWGSLLSGALGGYGQGGMSEAQLKLQGENAVKLAQEQGRQQRTSASYAAQLKDYYDQLDKNRKRTALDTYGQFSLMDRYAPNRTTVSVPQVPNYPTNG